MKVKYAVHYTLGYMLRSGVFVALVVFLGRNDTVMMSRSLPKLASYRSNVLIHDWIADHNDDRNSIIG